MDCIGTLPNPDPEGAEEPGGGWAGPELRSVVESDPEPWGTRGVAFPGALD